MAVRTEGATRASAAPFWYDQRFRAIFFQLLVLGLLGLFAAFIVYNTAQNLRQRGISSGFAFLWHTAGFDIGFSLIPYKATDTYGRVLLVGIINTLYVSAIGIFFATVLGF